MPAQNPSTCFIHFELIIEKVGVLFVSLFLYNVPIALKYLVDVL